ncbi:MAG: sugar ABC transporter permease [Actinobacteria bacterium]|nr:sugar ABC transporter permease [Actinomycetota bacterium]
MLNVDKVGMEKIIIKSNVNKIDNDRNIAKILLIPSILIILFLDMYPIIFALIVSFQKRSLFDISGIFAGIRNYKIVFRDPIFPTLVKNSIIWTISTTILEIILGTGVALLLNRNFKFRNIARGLLLVPYVVPVVCSTLVWKYMFNDIIGLINYLLTSIHIIRNPISFLSHPSLAMLVVIIINVWTYTPFVVINVLASLQNINVELYEAARIDGASPWQEFRRITIPSIIPILVIVTLLRTVWNFQKFEIIWLTTQGGPLNATTTLPVWVYVNAFLRYDAGIASSVAVIIFIILLLIAMLYIKVFETTERALG